MAATKPQTGTTAGKQSPPRMKNKYYTKTTLSLCRKRPHGLCMPTAPAPTFPGHTVKQLRIRKKKQLESPTTNLGMLSRLPPELLVAVIKQLDVGTALLSFARVNKLARAHLRSAPGFDLLKPKLAPLLRDVCGRAPLIRFHARGFRRARIWALCDEEYIGTWYSITSDAKNPPVFYPGLHPIAFPYYSSDVCGWELGAVLKSPNDGDRRCSRCGRLGARFLALDSGRWVCMVWDERCGPGGWPGLEQQEGDQVKKMKTSLGPEWFGLFLCEEMLPEHEEPPRQRPTHDRPHDGLVCLGFERDQDPSEGGLVTFAWKMLGR